MRVALVHDWLTGMRGGEKVLEALCELYPAAPIFTLIHNRGSVSKIIESHPIRTSYLQKAPMVKTHYRNFLPFFPKAIEKFQLQDFDLVISSSHCVAKGIIPSPTAVHVCYCHTPMRYIWSHYNDYFGKHRAGIFKRMILPPVRNYLCEWDVSTNQRVDQFIANSANVAARIKKFYGRESKILYPPVDVDYFTPSDSERGAFYLIVSALVPYKRLDLAIETFNKNGKTLVIVGTGPEFKQLKKMSDSNVQFLGRVEAVELRELYRQAAAMLQPGEEDFGINIVEALASQCPVIGYARGGVLESIVDGETGIFFNELTPAALQQAIDKASTIRFNKTLMRETALRFSPARFKSEFQRLIPQKATVNDGFAKK